MSFSSSSALTPMPEHSSDDAADIAELRSMMEYKRPHASTTERKFINRFIRPLGVTEDKHGNFYKLIGGDNARVMWCAHTDSVHRVAGKQPLVITANGRNLALDSPLDGCLGADNAAGVWLLMELIRAKVPGLYCFFRQEESGRIGSEAAALSTPELFAGIDYAIAFDRRGTKSIITHQMGDRCCSEAFAAALGAALNLGHEPDDGGSFTDTASFMTMVKECTNVSVGFKDEHTGREQLDLIYLLNLRDALLAVPDFEALPATRDPAVVDSLWGSYGLDDNFTSNRGGLRYSPKYDARAWGDDDEVDDFTGYPKKRQNITMRDIVESNPTIICDILEQSGYTVESLADAVNEITHFYPRKAH